jgi:hypothetical protein
MSLATNHSSHTFASREGKLTTFGKVSVYGSPTVRRWKTEDGNRRPGAARVTESDIQAVSTPQRRRERESRFPKSTHG